MRKVNEPFVCVQYDERCAYGVGARLGSQVLIVDLVGGLEDFYFNNEKDIFSNEFEFEMKLSSQTLTFEHIFECFREIAPLVCRTK